MCANPFDECYAAFGGSRPRADMLAGRVGSAFAEAGQWSESDADYERQPVETDALATEGDNSYYDDYLSSEDFESPSVIENDPVLELEPPYDDEVDSDEQLEDDFDLQSPTAAGPSAPAELLEVPAELELEADFIDESLDLPTPESSSKPASMSGNPLRL